jgi:hypothetical protein
MQLSDTGHPALVVSDFPEDLCPAGHSWTTDPEVSVLEASSIEQYVAESSGAGNMKLANILFFIQRRLPLKFQTY